MIAEPAMLGPAAFWPALVLFAKLVFAGCLVVAMATDVIRLEIPDTVSIVLLVVGSLLLVAHQPDLMVLLSHFGAAFLCFAIGAGLFFLGVWGGGDVKLLAAVSLWTGFSGLPVYVYWVGVLGGVLGLVILALRRLPAAWVQQPSWLARLHTPEQGVPYGVALGGAGLWLIDRIVGIVTASS